MSGQGDLSSHRLLRTWKRYGRWLLFHFLVLQTQTFAYIMHSAFVYTACFIHLSVGSGYFLIDSLGVLYVRETTSSFGTEHILLSPKHEGGHFEDRTVSSLCLESPNVQPSLPIRGC